MLEAILNGVKSAAISLGAGGAAVAATDLLGGGTVAKIIAGASTTVVVGGVAATHDIVSQQRQASETNAQLDALEELLSRVPKSAKTKPNVKPTDQPTKPVSAPDNGKPVNQPSA